MKSKSIWKKSKKTKDVELLISDYNVFLRQLNSNSESKTNLNFLHRNYFIAKQLYSKALAFYQEQKNQQKIKIYQTKIETLTKMRNFFEYGIIKSKTLLTYGGILSAFCLQDCNLYLNNEEFLKETINNKNVEYSIVEQFITTCVMIIFLLVAFFHVCAFFEFKILRSRKQKIEVPKIYFSVKEINEIILYGGVIPYTVYLTLINWNFFSGRNYSLFYNYFAIITQGLLLFFIVSIPLKLMILKKITKYSARKGIVLPKLKKIYFNLSICLLLSIFLANGFVSKNISLAVEKFMNDKALENVDVFWGICFTVLGLGIIFLLIHFGHKFSLKNKKNQSQIIFLLIFWRYVILFLIPLSIMFCSLNYSIAKYRECYYLKHDKIVFINDKEQKHYNEKMIAKKIPDSFEGVREKCCINRFLITNSTRIMAEKGALYFNEKVLKD